MVVALVSCKTSEAPSIDAAVSPDAAILPDASTTCRAMSPDSLAACAASVQAGTISTIEVQGSIVCSTAACRIAITGRSFTLRGSDGASIRRVDHHDGPLVNVVNAPSVVIADLTIDEDGDVPCTPVSATNPPVENPACGPTFDIFGATSVTIDHVTVAASKSQAAVISNSANVRVTHARFIAPLLFGLQVSGATSLTVEDTLFWHASSNAMVLYDTHGSDAAPLVIARTLFDHNHRDDVYYVCGDQGNQKCSGGQLLFSGLVDHLRVENTVIRDGATDTDPSVPAGGVEVNTPGVHDITFSGDDVHTHGMWGVYANPGQTDLAHVSFEGNKLYDNGTDPAYLGVDIGNFPDGIISEAGTCHAAGCATVPFGGLWALPGGSIGWATNDVAAPMVSVNGAPVATMANGQTSAATGALVILSNGAIELDRLIVP